MILRGDLTSSPHGQFWPESGPVNPDNEPDKFDNPNSGLDCKADRLAQGKSGEVLTDFVRFLSSPELVKNQLSSISSSGLNLTTTRCKSSDVLTSLRIVGRRWVLTGFVRLRPCRRRRQQQSSDFIEGERKGRERRRKEKRKEKVI
ncbi:hypothetical protein Droror1_Dr00012059 [Drosera rotundifolia]